MSRKLKGIHKKNTCELRSSTVGTTEADLSHGIDQTGKRNGMIFLEIRDNDVDPIILLDESNDNSLVRFDLRIEEAEALAALLLSDPEVWALHEERVGPTTPTESIEEKGDRLELSKLRAEVMFSRWLLSNAFNGGTAIHGAGIKTKEELEIKTDEYLLSLPGLNHLDMERIREYAPYLGDGITHTPESDELSQTKSELEFSRWLLSCPFRMGLELLKTGIKTREILAKKSDEDLLALPGFGKTSLAKVREYLQETGVTHTRSSTKEFLCSSVGGE